MKLELTTSKYCPCQPDKFFINGIEATEYDFGESESCHDFESNDCSMEFKRHATMNKEVLAKYNITEKEYNDICDELEIELSVGCCNACN